MQSELIILIYQLLRQVLFDVSSLNISLTLFKGTLKGKLFIEDQLFHTSLETVFVDDMTTDQCADIIMGYLCGTYRAFSEIAFVTVHAH